jgi:recombinational DNA repair protein RecT
VTDYAEMARKTVIKNGMKYVPKSIEVARAVQLDNAVESGDWTDIEFDAPEALSGLEAMPLAEGTSKKVAKAITANTDGIGLDYDPNADEELPYTGPTVREDD